MKEAVVFSIHYQEVKRDEDGGLFVADGLKNCKTSSPREAYALARDIAESTGFPTRIKCRALNVDRQILPKYLEDQGRHPDNL